MRVYRKNESETKGRKGYSASYVADVILRNPMNSAGIIIVEIPRNTKTEPHAHTILEEVFILMNCTRMGVGESMVELEEGDVVVAEPGELHWFETYENEDVTLVAIKMPNLKDDKITSKLM